MSDYGDDYATYDDVMQDLENDRYDESNDLEFRDYNGYCEHGVYVGGCGIDWMCQWCEDGISLAEARKIESQRKTRKIREQAEQAQKALNILLTNGVSGIDAAFVAERASNVNNPESRYGRTGWR